jgi:regulator of protease activity HflC (stomatin/prohibitin superfamily)
VSPLQITTMSVPAQDGITRDNVSVRVDAVVYFRVVDPVKAIVNVQNYMYAVSQVAQTSLRTVIGRADLDELLSNRDKLNAELTAIIDAPTEGPWGVKIERVEVKDVALPESMKPFPVELLRFLDRATHAPAVVLPERGPEPVPVG